MKVKKTSKIIEKFDDINWHDNTVYSVAFINERFELIFDIDYILEWIKPNEHRKNFRFKIAPGTLIFKNAYDLHLDLTTDALININQVERNNRRMNMNTNTEEWDWLIDCVEGTIGFVSSGCILSLNDDPVISDYQRISRKN